MKPEKSSLSNFYTAVITFLILAFFTAWWFLVDPFNSTGANENARTIWSSLYHVMAYWGGINGLFISRKWGGYKSIMGRAILAFSIGLILQGFGESVYSFYAIKFHTLAFYPSLGDIGFFGSIPCYIYGVILMAEASGVNISLKSYANKIQALLIPVAMLLLSYFLFLQNYTFDFNSPIKTFLDFAYPMGQAIYVSLAILAFSLSRKFLGGAMRFPILILLTALVFQYLSDYIFIYQFNAGSWYSACFNDYMYIFSYFLMTMALINLGWVFEKNKDN